MLRTLLLLCSGPTLVLGLFRTSVSEDAMTKCHTGKRSVDEPKCGEYATSTPEKLAATGEYPPLPDWCATITWEKATNKTNWGNCFSMTTDSKYRYISTNNVPDFYFNPYCPLGLGLGYCVWQEYASKTCMFPNLKCGEDNGPGSTKFGDVWVPQIAHYKILLKGDPTRPDRPGDMYDAKSVGAEKTVGPSTAVAMNGIGIQGPNDAGDVSIDEAGFILACGGHVTPPLGNKTQNNNQRMERSAGRHPHPEPGPNPKPPPPPGPGGPPLYHFHKSPECLTPFKNASIGVEHGATPFVHAKLIGWAIDGFGVYAYQDIDGAAPVVDECGGHFGPVDESGEVVYHYHSRPIVPYHLACQGPSLGKCAETQKGTNYCHPGCGYDVCVQPGTDPKKFTKYLNQFDPNWITKYTTNPFEKRRPPPPPPPPHPW